MKKCKRCMKYKKDVKLRVNQFKTAIHYDYNKKVKENLCIDCHNEYMEDI